MLVLLKVNGWTKQENIDDHSVKRGIVEIQFFQPPVEFLVALKNAVVPRVGTEPVLRLYHVGEYEQGLPVFEFK